jgi:hypothetical protein
MSEQIQDPIDESQKETTSIPPTYKYMNAHCAGLVQELQKSDRVKLVLWAQTSPFSEMMAVMQVISTCK